MSQSGRSEGAHDLLQSSEVSSQSELPENKTETSFNILDDQISWLATSHQNKWMWERVP